MQLQLPLCIILHVLFAVAVGVLDIQYSGRVVFQLGQGDDGLEKNDILISELVAVIESNLYAHGIQPRPRHFELKILWQGVHDLYQAAAGAWTSDDPFLLQLGGEDVQTLEIVRTGYHIPQSFEHTLNDGQHIYLNPTSMKIEFDFDLVAGDYSETIKVSETFNIAIKGRNGSRTQTHSLCASLEWRFPRPDGRGNCFDLSHVQSTEVRFYVEISLAVNGDLLLDMEVLDRTTHAMVFGKARTWTGTCDAQKIIKNELEGEYPTTLRRSIIRHGRDTGRGHSRIRNKQIRFSTDTAEIEQALLFQNYLADVLWDGTLSVDETSDIADVEVMDDWELKLVALAPDAVDLSFGSFTLSAGYYRLSDDGRKHKIVIRRQRETDYSGYPYTKFSQYHVKLVSQYVSGTPKEEKELFVIEPRKCKKEFVPGLFD